MYAKMKEIPNKMEILENIRANKAFRNGFEKIKQVQQFKKNSY